MKKAIFFLLSVLCSLHTIAQKETAWWYFGFKAGLNFNTLVDKIANDGSTVTNMPAAVTGPINTREGCCVVSTYDGSLLFTTDGSTVYNKNNAVMTNGTGLLGSSSSAQSAITFPKPGSTTEYYIITTPASETTQHGIRYSIVDISQSGGLGAVTTKNAVIKSGTLNENIAAVPHSNEEDYWIIHRSVRSFYVWAVTKDGVNLTHATYTEPSIANSVALAIIVSPDYTKILSTNGGGTNYVTADFDSSTGIISGIKNHVDVVNIYSGTFSSNSKYFYAGGGRLNLNAYIVSWDDLRNSGTKFTKIFAGPSNLLRASDNRIYGIQCGSDPSSSTKHLYVIEDPDNGDTNAKYFPNYLVNGAHMGLPTFAAGFIRIKAKEQPFACASHNRTYSVEIDLSGGNAPDKLEWYFGDGSAKITQAVTTSQSKYSQVYSYNNAGTYTIEVTPYKTDGTKLKTITMVANIVGCTLKTNRMTRSDLLNSKQQQ